MTEQPQFSGAIVLKCRSEPETAALAQQLAWYAAFGDVFSNRYEGGYAVKGQVYVAPPDGAPDTATLEAQNREQAARLAALEQQIKELTWEASAAKRARDSIESLMGLLSQEEYLRLIDRNIMREWPDLWVGAAIEDTDNPSLQALARTLLERAARIIETEAPDDVHVTLRAAEHCAALVRGLMPKDETPATV